MRNNNISVMRNMMAHDILGMKRRTGIAIGIVTSSKLLKDTLFDLHLEKQDPPPSLKQP